MMVLIAALIGVVGGILSGLLGIGGAIFIIPALVFILGFDQKLAQGTTLLLMLPPVGLFAFLEYYKNGYVNLKVGLFMAAFFVIGAWIGAKIVINTDMNVIRKAFAIFLGFVAVKLFLS